VKVVLDTNVILAAFATRGLCESVMAVCLDRHDVYLSEHILSEVAEHLADKFKMPTARVRGIVAFLRLHATIVKPSELPANTCRDEDDLPILGTAVAAAADCLVTGDNDLLALGKLRGISILSPRQFYDQLR
jgi:putative PIN family toxin of toxin-antitoxin system